MHRVTKDETENEKIGFSWPILKAIWVQYSSIFFFTPKYLQNISNKVLDLRKKFHVIWS